MSANWLRLRAFLLLLPLLLIMLAVVGWPLINTVMLSFTSSKLVGPTGENVGVANYLAFASNPDFWAAAFFTLKFTVLSVGLELMLGIGAAVVLNQPFFGRTFVRALMIVPWALPTIVNATLWRLIYNPEYGAANSLLYQLGLIDAYRSWLGDLGAVLGAIIIADAWKNFPIVALIALAALQAVPKETKSAALVDGAGPLRSFFYVDVPYLVGPVIIAVVLRTIEAFKVFDIIWIMTKGGPANSTRSLSIMVYQEAFSFQRAGSGASLALIVALMTTVLAVTYVLAIRKATTQS